MQELCKKFQKYPGMIWFKLRSEIGRFLEESFNDSSIPCFVEDVYGTKKVTRIDSSGGRPKLGDSDMLCRVSAAPFEVEISFVELSDNRGARIDVSLKTRWRISSPEPFLEERGIYELQAEGVMSVASLERDLRNLFCGYVTDEIQKREYEDLKERDACPSGWWKKQLAQRCTKPWLELMDIVEVSYVSSSEDRRREHEKKLEQKESEEAYLRKEFGKEEEIRILQHKKEQADRESGAEAELQKIRLEKELLIAREDLENIQREALRKQKLFEAELAELERRIRGENTGPKEAKPHKPYCGKSERLLLEVASSGKRHSIVLFASTTIFLGRSSEESLFIPLPWDMGKKCHANDLLLRRVEKRDGALHALYSESYLISRGHAVLSLMKRGEEEELWICDTGADGRGSTCGTWLNGGKIPRGGRERLASGDEITFGKKGSEEGLSLQVHITSSQGKMQFIELRRKDALADTHRYIMIAERAEIRKPKGGALLGEVRFEDGRFLWSGGSEKDRPLFGGETINLKGGAILSARPVKNEDFWENLPVFKESV